MVQSETASAYCSGVLSFMRAAAALAAKVGSLGWMMEAVVNETTAFSNSPAAKKSLPCA